MKLLGKLLSNSHYFHQRLCRSKKFLKKNNIDRNLFLKEDCDHKIIIFNYFRERKKIPVFKNDSW